DNLNNYYSPQIKKNNLKPLLKNKNFYFLKKDLIKTDLDFLLKNVTYILHMSAYPGVRKSWGDNFKVYLQNNILVTQLLLEKIKENKNIKKFIFASSSSIYGNTNVFPTNENIPLNPISPYGVSKLAAEKLCNAYYKNYDIPLIVFRYFTVYGPGQRPDMAFHRFIKEILNNKEIIIFGNGKQIRDFTFIENIVNANIKAIQSKIKGEVFNIGSGEKISVNNVIKILEKITQKKAKVKYIEKQKGDVENTFADITHAKKLLNYSPVSNLYEGLYQEYEWIKNEFIK
ncbi:MAG: NAD-dependent epimerase/dehydratase family protein, partial [bacterium]